MIAAVYIRPVFVDISMNIIAGGFTVLAGRDDYLV